MSSPWSLPDRWLKRNILKVRIRWREFMNCPKCSKDLVLYNREGLNIGYCKSCKSVWVPDASLMKISEKLELKGKLINPIDMEPLKIKEELRACPQCGKTMHKVFFNGIIADKCVDCRGVWFDNGELSKYFNLFMKEPVGVIDNLVFLEKYFNPSAAEQNTIKASTPAKTEPQSLPKKTIVPEVNNEYSHSIDIQSKEEERKVASISGFFVVLVLFIAAMAAWLFYAIGWSFLGFILTVGIVVGCMGFKLLRPQEALVLTVFGKYIGTLKGAGFHWVNPLAQSVTMFVPVSLKAMTLENGKQKINDELGNPIEVGIIVIWEVQDTAKAMFNVDNYKTFLSVQSDSALRNIVRTYPYDAPEESGKQTLRGDSQEISEKLKAEIQKNVRVAGLNIVDAKITHLAYAPEIAVAMLQRQQASAIIDAKKAIVEGAVGMVEMALQRLKDDNVVNLSDDEKAKMVNNLLVVLCSNKEAQPVLKNDLV